MRENEAQKKTLLPFNHPDLLHHAADLSTACDTVCAGIILRWRHLHGFDNFVGLVVLVVAMEIERLLVNLKQVCVNAQS